MKTFQLKHRPKTALVIAVPGLGDAMLSTPLIRSLHAAYPGIQVDMLVRKTAVSILQDIPEIRDVLCFDHKSRFIGYVSMVKEIFRKYDLAVSTSSSDKATLGCFYAAPKRVGIVPPYRPQDWWKRKLLHGWAELDLSKHTLIQNLMLAKVLGINEDKNILLPVDFDKQRISKQLEFDFKNNAYAVMQCFPSAQNKKWPMKYWEEVILHLADKGLHTILTGGPTEEECQFAASLHEKFPQQSSIGAGRLNFSDLVYLLKNAAAYVGVDTCVSHIAAALGTPSVCLFGPSNLIKWAPWPNGYEEGVLPFSDTPGVQKVEKVAIVRGKCSCGVNPAKCTQVGLKENSLCMKSIQPKVVNELLDEHLFKDVEDSSSQTASA